MDGTRHLFIDPSLRRSEGHHLMLARAYAERVAPEKVWFAVHRRAGPLRGLPADAIMPAFRHSMAEASRLRRYGRFGRRLASIGEALGLEAARRRRLGRSGAIESAPPRAGRDAAGAHSLHTDDLLTACARFAPQKGDLLVFESGDAEQALAAAECLESGAAGGAGIHFRLMYDDVARHPPDFTWRSALRRLAAASRTSAVSFSTETAVFAAAVRDTIGHPVSVRPHPSRLPAAPAPPGTGPFVLFVPGEARSDKGLALLRSVAALVPPRLRERVLIRVQAPIENPLIERLPTHLGEDDYAGAWVSCHAALLLHEPAVYALRGSGVVCDAVAVGRPFICLAGSSLAEWAKDGNGLVVSPDVASVAKAIEDMVDRYPTLLQRADTARVNVKDATQTPADARERI